MDSYYVTQQQFDKAPTVQRYPNPAVKIGLWEGRPTRLTVAGQIQLQELDPDSANWYGYDQGETVLLASCQDGFFPTELFCRIVNHRYVPLPEFGLSLGKNLGTASVLFFANNRPQIVARLEEHNFQIIN